MVRSLQDGAIPLLPVVIPWPDTQVLNQLPWHSVVDRPRTSPACLPANVIRLRPPRNIVWLPRSDREPDPAA